MELKAVRENKEIRRPVKEEYGLIFDGSPTDSGRFLRIVTVWVDGAIGSPILPS